MSNWPVSDVSTTSSPASSRLSLRGITGTSRFTGADGGRPMPVVRCGWIIGIHHHRSYTFAVRSSPCTQLVHAPQAPPPVLTALLEPGARAGGAATNDNVEPQEHRAAPRRRQRGISGRRPGRRRARSGSCCPRRSSRRPPGARDVPWAPWEVLGAIGWIESWPGHRSSSWPPSTPACPCGTCRSLHDTPIHAQRRSQCRCVDDDRSVPVRPRQARRAGRVRPASSSRAGGSASRDACCVDERDVCANKPDVAAYASAAAPRYQWRKPGNPSQLRVRTAWKERFRCSSTGLFPMSRLRGWQANQIDRVLSLSLDG